MVTAARGDDPGLFLEIAVGRKRHPEGVEFLGGCAHRGASNLTRHGEDAVYARAAMLNNQLVDDH